MTERDHRVVEDWMGKPVETLEDLLKPGLFAVCVGINPAPTSVRAGHYYQGRLGQKLFARLHQAGVVPPGRGGWQDDEALAAGVGFTDIVKRPTAKASQIRPDEFVHGQGLKLAHSDVFVMPAPYEGTGTVRKTLGDLGRYGR